MNENVIKLKRRPAAERIVAAMALLRSVEQEQNTAFQLCSECTLKHYEDLEAVKVANKLKGVQTTLTNVLERLS